MERFTHNHNWGLHLGRVRLSPDNMIIRSAVLRGKVQAQAGEKAKEENVGNGSCSVFEAHKTALMQDQTRYGNYSEGRD